MDRVDACTIIIIKEDPEERKNLAKKLPDTLKAMLVGYQATYFNPN